MNRLLEIAVSIALYIGLSAVLLLTIKFEAINTSLLKDILSILVFLGVAVVTQFLIDAYKVLIYYLEKRNKK